MSVQVAGVSISGAVGFRFGWKMFALGGVVFVSLIAILFASGAAISYMHERRLDL